MLKFLPETMFLELIILHQNLAWWQFFKKKARIFFAKKEE